jgi:hypothetical protein
MRRTGRILLICGVFFALLSLSFAAEFYVIKDSSGKMIVVDKRPADAAVIVKGPFPTRAEAEVIIGSPAPGAAAPVPAPGAPVKPGPPPPSPPGR